MNYSFIFITHTVSFLCRAQLLAERVDTPSIVQNAGVLHILISASLETFSFLLPTVVDIITDLDMDVLYCIHRIKKHSDTHHGAHFMLLCDPRNEHCNTVQ
jgi:hypothetical protein